ncbi:hypothetical protein BS47DRAFT_334909 [Hydnum rufescens UP504]|uniref:NADH dehydrogenase [ubiquinone] 1 alpha subcomplex subunit 11 n=1 Tax=Hydnum rufescens UP504 TaxID=1448309 RepID=A0A9P6B7E3_9AGAM|nr:hypothetical protein BS47DRAFT_334909 [Hydnum rufescens UP504]
MGATFALGESVVANIRQTNDPLNGVAGGCAAGFLAGIRARSFPIALGSCVVLGGMIGTLDASGGKLTGDGRDVESKEQREKRRQSFFKHKEPPEPIASSQ